MTAKAKAKELPPLPELPSEEPAKDVGGRGRYKPDVPNVAVVAALEIVHFKAPINVGGVPMTFAQSRDFKIQQLSDRTIQVGRRGSLVKKTVVPFENIASFIVE